MIAFIGLGNVGERYSKTKHNAGFWVIDELAKRNNVMVLPICHNSGDCWPAHKFVKRAGTIKLILGKPFYVKDSKYSAEKVQSWVKDTLMEKA